MPKKRSPILDKVTSFIKISMSLPKMRKPVTLNLIFFKKFKRTKKFKLLRHYNYRFIQEYQFSASNCNTPLILHHHHPNKQYYYSNSKEERKIKDFHSMLLMCFCLGGFGAQEGERNDIYSSMEVLPAVENRVIRINEDEELEIMSDLSGTEDGSSVDERAERFIEKFYDQMRLQSRESTRCSVI